MNGLYSSGDKPRVGFSEVLLLVAAIFAFLSPARSQDAPLPEGSEKATVESVCTACHTTGRIVNSNRSRDEWQAVVRQMIGNGAELPENKITPVVDYLAKAFPALPAGPAPRTPDGKPDFSGTWTGQGLGRPLALDWTNVGKDNFDWNQEPSLARGGGERPVGEEAVIGGADPRMRARRDQDPYLQCYPPGLVRLGPPINTNGGGSGLVIIQLPDRLTLIYEQRSAVRYVYTDGRPHPKPLELTWNGHSIGRWDGDTLVVDTQGIRDEGWLDTAGNEHTDRLHVVERWRRVDFATLEVERTLTDPIVMKSPYTYKASLKLSPRYTVNNDTRNDDCTQYMMRKPAFGEGINGVIGIFEHP
jgi:hypothetical protein